MDLAARAEAYIWNLEQALEKLRRRSLGEPYSRLLEAAELYARDAEYYLEAGDAATALVCASYAEGLLDALKYLGVVEAEWRSLGEALARPRVLVAGTFDLIHPGHIYLLREAWLRGRVYAVAARDETVRRVKGREPIVPLEQRLEVLNAIRYVYKAIPGDERDWLKPIEEVKPNIVLLGPDQQVDEVELQRRLEERGVRVRVERLPRRISCPLCSTTAIACRVLRVFPRELCRE